MMRRLVIASIAWTVGHAQAWASGDGATLSVILNPHLAPVYRLGAAHNQHGDSVRIQYSLLDIRKANEYEREVRQFADPGVAGERLAGLALLAAVGSPAPENMGILFFSPDAQAPTVAAISAAYSTINRERVTSVPRTLAFDGHVHTGLSHDGGDGYEGVFLAAAARNLDAIAITDHNEFDYQRAQGVLNQLKAQGRISADFLLVPGEEVSTSEGHVLAYFIHRKIESGMTAAATIRAIHNAGGIAVAAHPSSGSGVGMRYAKKLPFDGIEVMSGANVQFVGMSLDMQAANYSIPGKFNMANSDAHAAAGIGVMYTRVGVDEPTLAGLRKGLIAGRATPVVLSPVYRGYIGWVHSPAFQTMLWPVLTYLTAKSSVLGLVAYVLQVDRLSFITNWEYAALRAADGIFLPIEAGRLARGVSEFQKPFDIRSAAATKGPFRLSYEQFDLQGFTRVKPMTKLEIVVDF